METCAACEKEIYGQRCRCGHVAEYAVKAPRNTPHDALVVELQACTHKNVPTQLLTHGNGIDAAARRWVALQGPRQSGEHVSTRWYGGRVRIVDPYTDRLRATLRAFIALDDFGRAVVLLAASDGLYWRGEPVPQFRVLLDEFRLARQIGPDNYRSLSRAAIAAMGKI